MTGRGFAIILAILLFVLAAGAAGARGSGPALDVDPALLHSALSCPGGLTHADRPVVLLVHGTGATAKDSWPDGYGKTLPLAGFDWCMVQLPDHALGDIQVSSEYVVAAVRELAAETGRRVDLIGHSQGAIEIRWAVRFWPDVRADVDDLITVAGANNGVDTANDSCALGHCAPALWQMRVGAALETALNKVPAPAGPSYTAIYSNTDELVRPATAATFAGASNVLLQDICPGRYESHAYEIFDAVSIAAALDALEHTGPADPARIPRTVCNEIAGPGIDPATSMTTTTTYSSNAAVAISTHPTVTSEPPLRDYASGSTDAPAGGPANAFGLIGQRRLRGGAVRIVMHVPSAGVVTITGPRAHGKALLRRTVLHSRAAGTVRAALRLTAPGRRLLRARRSLEVSVRVAFAPADEGPAAIRALRLKFRRASR